MGAGGCWEDYIGTVDASKSAWRALLETKQLLDSHARPGHSHNIIITIMPPSPSSPAHGPPPPSSPPSSSPPELVLVAVCALCDTRRPPRHASQHTLCALRRVRVVQSHLPSESTWLPMTSHELRPRSAHCSRCSRGNAAHCLLWDCDVWLIIL